MYKLDKIVGKTVEKVKREGETTAFIYFTDGTCLHINAEDHPVVEQDPCLGGAPNTDKIVVLSMAFEGPMNPEVE